MSYDFKTLPNRRGLGSSKWDAMLAERSDLPEDVVPLSVADMELANAPEIKAALHELIDAGPLGYASPTKRFFDACVAWQQRRHSWSPSAEWIVTSPGVVPALYNAVRTLTQPDDGVIIQPPVYYPFRMAVERSGRRVVENPLVERNGRYEMDLEDLARKASDPSVSMLILCSPHNPVGRVWTPEELRAVLDICLANNVLVVSDEIHDDLIMPGHEHMTLMRLAADSERERIVVCTAPSKTFNLAGCQASVIYLANSELREKFSAGFYGIGMHHLNAFAYAATIAAYESGERWLSGLLALVWENYQRLVAWARRQGRGIAVYPLEGTYLAWVDFRSLGLDACELERFMKDEALLWLDEGKLFGVEGEGFERINLACPTSVLDASLERLATALDNFGKENR